MTTTNKVEHGTVYFSPHLAVFDKIGIDWTPPVTACSPLQVVHVRLVSLRRADDDGRLWSGTVAAPVRWQADRVIFRQEELVALVVLHGVQRW